MVTLLLVFSLMGWFHVIDDDICTWANVVIAITHKHIQFHALFHLMGWPQWWQLRQRKNFTTVHDT